MRALLAAWCGGLLVVQVLPALPGPGWRLAALLLALPTLPWRRTRAVGCGLLALGYGLWVAAGALDERLPPGFEGRTVRFTGVVADFPRREMLATRFVLERARGLRAGWPDGRQRVRLTWYGPRRMAPVPGARCVLYARVMRARGLRNLYSFDSERYQFAQGTDAVGYVIDHPANRCDPHAQGPIARWRMHVANAIQHAVPVGSDAAIMTALAVGVRADIEDHQWQILRDTGVVHLVSVSGLHVAMVAGGAFLVLRIVFAVALRASAGASAPVLAALVALGLAGAYAALAGFTVPTQRALVMTAIAMWNKLHARPLFSLDSLLLAASVVLACAPAASLTASFWLSFGAVALLAYLEFARAMRGCWARWFGIHLCMAGLLVPVLGFAFQQVPLVSPLANAVAVPAVTLCVVPLLLIGTLIEPWAAGVAAGCWHGAAFVWELTWRFLDACAGWVPVVRLPFRPEWPGLVVGLAGVAGLFVPVGAIRGLLAPGLLIAFLAAPYPAPRVGQFVLDVLDVGQGLSVVVRTRRHTLVYDAGARYPTGADMGRDVVVPHLHGIGTRRIDRLVISHSDNDHAGGAAALREALPVAEFLSSSPRVGGVRARACRRGQRWRWDGVVFEVLHPGAARGGSDNDRSCVLRISGVAGSALLAGDIEDGAERTLLGAVGRLATDVLIVPHHGSGTSSSAAFVAAVAPRLAIVSAGYRNRFRHPDPVVVARYRALGAQCLTTGELGLIRVDFGAEIAAPFSTRVARRRYWDP